jgi:SAM-dependent methyltransferase
MNWEAIDWPALDRLRSTFLEGSAGRDDYWTEERDIASYDETFAQRIAWKWDYVLKELPRRGWNPPVGPALDWGCGSGVAGRVFVEHFKPQVSSLRLWDRSALAVRFAAARARQKFPHLDVREETSVEGSPVETLLLSHVLTELNEEQLGGVLNLVREATTVLWVEPGTRQASRRLSAVRDSLLGAFHVVAPCTHQAICGVLTPENVEHWCHHFAPPPREIFTDGNWARFAALAGVDLRSLPLSFLVLDKRPGPDLPPGATRVLGNPRIYKGYALLLGCSACGVCERRLSERNFREAFRHLKKGKHDPLQIWEVEEREIRAASPLHPPS